jgi:hypothetical protein
MACVPWGQPVTVAACRSSALCPLCPVPYGSISRIEATPLEDHLGYSVVCLQLGAGGTSRLWLYFYPSQYVAGLKIRCIGIEALL